MAKEISKIHETYFRGTLGELSELLEAEVPGLSVEIVDGKNLSLHCEGALAAEDVEGGICAQLMGLSGSSVDGVLTSRGCTLLLDVEAANRLGRRSEGRARRTLTDRVDRVFKRLRWISSPCGENCS